MSMKLGEAGAAQALLGVSHPLDVIRSRDFLVAWLSPAALFLVITFFYAYGFMRLPSVCVLLTSGSLLLGGHALSLRNRGPMWCPIALGTFVGAVSGSFLGLYVFDQYTVFPMFYENSRTYTNVVPSQPSAAVADAGKIIFSPDSFVDSSHAVSYITEYGDLYCVAPVRDNSNVPSVEFWVTGMNCCSQSGDFWCDSARDAQAHAGIVVFSNQGFFGGTVHDPYEKARLKAEATYGLRSAARPAYVRWVREDNMDMVSDYYRNRAAGFLTAFIIMYAGASFAFTYAFYRPLMAYTQKAYT